MEPPSLFIFYNNIILPIHCCPTLFLSPASGAPTRLSAAQPAALSRSARRMPCLIADNGVP